MGEIVFFILCAFIIFPLNRYFQTLKINNDSRDTKSAYKFMVIIPLMAIELKATPNGNPTNYFYCRQKSNSLNVVLSSTTSRAIIFFSSKSTQPN